MADHDTERRLAGFADHLQAYLRTLETERLEDWQVEQARMTGRGWT